MLNLVKVYCLQENILSSPRDGDLGAVFGLGFPPFLGGPFRYCDLLGIEHICDDMLKLSEEFGERFTPCKLIQDMAKNHSSFY